MSFKYPIVVAKMAERGIKKVTVARKLGITAKAFENKLRGKTPISWEQVQTVQQSFFPDIPKDELFSTDDETEDTTAKEAG